MKIYINGKFLNQRATGVQNYASGMIGAMKEAKIDFEILVPKSTKISDTYQIRKIGSFSNLLLWEQISLPLFVNRQKNSLLINFCNSAPLLSKRQIVTVHDLAFEQKKAQWFSIFFKKWYQFLMPRLCRSAKSIYTVSEFSKNEICRHYEIQKERIRIIPNGLPSFIQPAERLVPDDYLLVVAGDNPRKNLKTILDQITDIEKHGLKLVILDSGTLGFKRFSDHVPSSVIFLDYATKQEYYSLIKYAKALVYPSLYEGFGIPVLESLYLKTPVICNDLEVYKESFGDLPVYFQASKNNTLDEALNRCRHKTISDSDVKKLSDKFSFNRSVSLILKSLVELNK